MRAPARAPGVQQHEDRRRREPQDVAVGPVAERGLDRDHHRRADGGQPDEVSPAHEALGEEREGHREGEHEAVGDAAGRHQPGVRRAEVHRERAPQRIGRWPGSGSAWPRSTQGSRRPRATRRRTAPDPRARYRPAADAPAPEAHAGAAPARNDGAPQACTAARCEAGSLLPLHHQAMPQPPTRASSRLVPAWCASSPLTVRRLAALRFGFGREQLADLLAVLLAVDGCLPRAGAPGHPDTGAREAARSQRPSPFTASQEREHLRARHERPRGGARQDVRQLREQPAASAAPRSSYSQASSASSRFCVTRSRSAA